MKCCLGKILGASIGLGMIMMTACTSSQERTSVTQGVEEETIVQETRLTIDTRAEGTKISEDLYGAFYEDINNSADNGLYAELVLNRSFEFDQKLEGWSKYTDAQGDVILEARNDTPIHENNPNYIRVEVKSTGSAAGISNSGLSGINVEEGMAYNFSAYLRSADSQAGLVRVCLVDKDNQVLAQAEMQMDGTWKKYDVKLVATGTYKSAKLVLVTDDTAIWEADVVSLFPSDTYNGRENGLRKDLATMIADFEPSFFRFPGGCIVEGLTMDNAYNWKDTVGPVETRPINKNLWGYYQSYGLGFYEYFQYCEDMGATPLPVINVGMACQVRGGDLVAMADLAPYIQDALDLIEYATGDSTTKWGALRAESGHEEPFELKYLAVGNEQWGSGYYERYERFYDAIKAVYPDLQLIFAAGPMASGSDFEDAWTYAKSGKVDIVDEHYYMPPNWFFNNVDRYDDYDRNGPKVFVGEYAAHDSGDKNTMLSALAEAAFMTGIEKNSDVVAMASYAPLLAFDKHIQWSPDLIWFNQGEVYGTPNYYVQQMYSRNRGSYVLENKLEIATAERSEGAIAGKIGVGAWRSQVSYKDIQVTAADGAQLYNSADIRNLDDWAKKAGQWSLEDGVISQTGNGENCYMYVGDETWTDYTLSMKAQKSGGNEGFLILFGTRNVQDYYWWNLGGWNNTVSAIESAKDGSKSTLISSPVTPIENGRWYDIKVEVQGENIKCYLDGVLVHEIEDSQAYDPLYAAASRDDDGSIIIKLVNASDRVQVLDIDLDGMETGDLSGTATVLKGDGEDDANTFKEPENIVPTVSEIELNGPTFEYSVDPYSLTILRVK